MSRTICPGQDTMFWTPGDVYEIPCANCGELVEFFKDDAKRRCHRCGQLLRNPKLNLGCAQWCEHAKECLGYDPKEKMAQADTAEEALVDRLIANMKTVFGSDQRRISHALSVLNWARRILAAEGGDPRVVLAAAVLHDVGIHAAEKKHGSSAGRFQELEGPPIAESIMVQLGLDRATIDHVTKIIANHHSAREIDTTEFRIVWDADWLVNLPEEFPEKDRDSLAKLIGKLFKTRTGRDLAEALYINNTKGQEE